MSSVLARLPEPAEPTCEAADPRDVPQPFAVRFAERFVIHLVPKPESPVDPEIFDDPTTVDYTHTNGKLDEDPHTDEF